MIGQYGRIRLWQLLLWILRSGRQNGHQLLSGVVNAWRCVIVADIGGLAINVFNKITRCSD